MRNAALLVTLLGAAVLTGCANEPDEYEVKEYTTASNPAAVYCVKQQGELDTVSENDRRVTYCVLPDGSRQEQWEYYRESQQQQSQ